MLNLYGVDCAYWKLYTITEQELKEVIIALVSDLGQYRWWCPKEGPPPMNIDDRVLLERAKRAYIERTYYTNHWECPQCRQDADEFNLGNDKYPDGIAKCKEHVWTLDKGYVLSPPYCAGGNGVYNCMDGDLTKCNYVSEIRERKENERLTYDALHAELEAKRLREKANKTRKVT